MTTTERQANELLSDAALRADLRKLRNRKARKAYPPTFAERMANADKKRGFFSRVFA